MQRTPRQDAAVSALTNKLLVIQGIDRFRDDLLDIMVRDWITNADPNEPGFENPAQMKALVEDLYGGFVENQQAQQLFDAWIEFVPEYYALNGGKRRKTRKHKKRSKKTRRH